MRMARGVRASKLIFNGSDNSEHPLPAAVAVNAKAVRAIQARQRLRLGMAAEAGLGGFVEDMADFRRISRVADRPLSIKNADLDHARFGGGGLNRGGESLAIVAQHVVSRAAFDYVADALGTGQRGCFQVLAMQSDIQISE